MNINLTETINIGIMISLFFLCFTNKADGVGLYHPLKTSVSSSFTLAERLKAVSWEDAKELSGFIRINGEPAEQQTTVAICYDKETLYFRIECFETNINHLKNTVKNAQGQVWEDDSIEIFIAPDPMQSNSYYQFAANSIGTRYARGFNSKISMGMPWDVHAEIKTASWVLKIAIPLLSLGLSEADDKGLFLMSVCRGRKAGETEYSVWPIGGWFHNPGGHFTLTSYIVFLQNRLFPLWEEQKEKVFKFLKMHPETQGILQKQLEKLIEPVETDKEKLTKDSHINSEEFNFFLEQFRESMEKMKSLESQIRYNFFLFSLKEFFK